MKKPTDEQDMDIQDEIVDAGTTGDLRGVIDLLRAGKVNQDLLNVAAALLEQVAADPKHQRAVARKQRDVQMRMDIENEYRNRLQGPLACFGVTISEDEQEQAQGVQVTVERLIRLHPKFNPGTIRIKLRGLIAKGYLVSLRDPAHRTRRLYHLTENAVQTLQALSVNVRKRKQRVATALLAAFTLLGSFLQHLSAYSELSLPV